MTGLPNLLLMVWGAITIVLAGLFMWRYLTGFREENVVMLDAGASSMASEQREVTAKLGRINGMISIVGGLWGIVALGVFCMWIYQAWVSFNGG